MVSSGVQWCPVVFSGVQWCPVVSGGEAPGGGLGRRNWDIFDALTAILGTEKQQN